MTREGAEIENVERLKEGRNEGEKSCLLVYLYIKKKMHRYLSWLVFSFHIGEKWEMKDQMRS